MSKCMFQTVQSHKPSMSNVHEAFPRSLAAGDAHEVLRMGRRQGVTLTLCAEAIVVVMAAFALPEVRGKLQETFSNAQRRTRDASFRLHHKGDCLE